jgi:hypothetical protein
MRDKKVDPELRVRAAITALPYCHVRRSAGKKDARAEAATVAAQGKFAPTRAPRRLALIKSDRTAKPTDGDDAA